MQFTGIRIDVTNPDTGKLAGTKATGNLESIGIDRLVKDAFAME